MPEEGNLISKPKNLKTRNCRVNIAKYIEPKKRSLFYCAELCCFSHLSDQYKVVFANRWFLVVRYIYCTPCTTPCFCVARSNKIFRVSIQSWYKSDHCNFLNAISGISELFFAFFFLLFVVAVCSCFQYSIAFFLCSCVQTANNNVHFCLTLLL